MVSVENGSSSSGITVSWKEPNCSDINDERVIGYRIRYGLHSLTQQMNTPLITSRTFTLTRNDNDLQLFMDYSIEVAAVNSRGVGTFSQPKTAVITGGGYCFHEIKFKLNYLCFLCSPWTCQFTIHRSRYSFSGTELGASTTRGGAHHTV